MQLRSPYLLSLDRLRDVAVGGRPLSEGEASPATAQAKAALLDLGYGRTGAPGAGQATDQTFGMETAELVRSFQRDKGLGQTGAFDAATLLAADQALAVQVPLSPPRRGRGSRTSSSPLPQSPRNAPPVGSPARYPLYYHDKVYHSETTDPYLEPDVGAGAWNSHRRTFSSITLAESASTACKSGVAQALTGYNAMLHLRHYLGNSGHTYTIDLDGLIRAVPSARNLFIQAYRQAQHFLQQLPLGRHDFSMRYAQPGQITPAESRDWYYAIGSYAAWGKGRVAIIQVRGERQYDMDFRYKFFDRYNWDHGKSTPLVAGIVIQDETLAEFHRQGIAREFDCVGEISRRSIWMGNVALADAALVQGRGR